MTSSANTDARPTACMFPGCERPVRDRAGEGGGKPPIYCDLVNPATGKLAHTPLTAARERGRQQRQRVTGHPAGRNGDAPASLARDRAVGLLDQFRTAVEQMSGTLDAAIEAMSAASDPETVSAELTAARRQVERTRLEADERIQTAEAARHQAAADTVAAHQAAAEAAAARDEAISELDALDATLGTTRAELEQARAEYTAERERLRAEHASDLDQQRAESERQLTAVRTAAAEQQAAAEAQATEQVRAAQTDAAGRIHAAEAARDQALTEASAARQAATDATRHAEQAREELRQARTEHREELTALRREHRDELTAERQRTDTALDTLRAEHRRETETLQTALTALQGVTAKDEQPAPPGLQATQSRGKRGTP
ncbi:MAG: hypothetical protein M3Y73_01525 [Actinomycetota bacterium]|nr:hypothetical protein [Actinomycetota bacterium]